MCSYICTCIYLHVHVQVMFSNHTLTVIQPFFTCTVLQPVNLVNVYFFSVEHGNFFVFYCIYNVHVHVHVHLQCIYAYMYNVYMHTCTCMYIHICIIS